MKTLKDIQHLKGVKVLVRADFNVSIQNGKIADPFRIKVALPTMEYLIGGGAKVILMSHLEVKEGERATLEPIADEIAKLGIPVTFVKNIRSAVSVISNMKDGDCILLENLRSFEGEKSNDPKFAKELASLGDIYVNDAFPVCHREHASVVGVPSLMPSYAGFQLEKEIVNISRAFKPNHPFLFILCGAKFETKLPLLDKFIQTADSVFVGGALAHDIFKAKGYETGASLVSAEKMDLSRFASNPKLSVPTDVVLTDKKTKMADSLSKTDVIADAGPKTLAHLKELVNASRFILWNGPLGIYEEGFKETTIELARMIATATKQNGVTSIVGGGDTLAAINELNNHSSFTFVSSGGGAMLDFLAKGTLPGIQALEHSPA
jgi:phosphoglycerate kinase